MALLSARRVSSIIGPQGPQGQVGNSGLRGLPGPQGPQGSTGAGAVIGSASVGAATAIEDIEDWVSIAGGTTATVEMLTPDLISGEVVHYFADILVEQQSGAPFAFFNRTICVRNNSGTLTTVSGGTSDTDISATGNVPSALAGLTAAIVIVGATLAVQVTAPSGIAIFAGASTSVNRRVPPGSVTVPTVTSASVGTGNVSGGTTTVLTGLHFLSPSPVTSVTLDGVAATFVINSNTQITATSGAAGGNGTGNILASSSFGGTPLVNAWTYTGGVSATLASIIVDIGPYEGGSTITGTGTNLTGYGIKINGVACTGVVIGGGGTTFTATTPTSTGATAGGYVGVQAFLGGSTSNTLSGTAGYFYLPQGLVAGFTPTLGTVPSAPTNGTLLSGWTDFFGSNSLAQATGANQPPWIASSVNGQPAVRMTTNGGSGAAPQWMLGTYSTTKVVTAYTQLIIGQRTTDAGNSPWLMASWPAGATGLTAIVSANSEILIDNGTSAVPQGFVNGGISGTGPSIVANTTPTALSVRSTGSTTTVRSNGTDGTPASRALPATAWGQFTIASGTNVPADNRMVGSWDTLFAATWSRALVTADFTSLSTYTVHKWSITGV